MARAVWLFLLLSLSSSVAAAPKRARTTHPSKPTRPKPPTSRERYPAIPIFGAHVGESLSYRPYDDRGRARKDAARALERLLRNRQTGARHRVHPRLGDALYKIGRHFAGHRIEIFSGYRPRAYCDRAHSRHMTGSAVDFHVEGVSNDVLLAFLKKTFHPAGVGAYPHGVHVHLDLERTVDTYWVDRGPPAADPAITPPARDTAPLPTIEPNADEDAEIAEPVALPAAPLGEPPAGDPLLGTPADDPADDEAPEQP